MGADINLYVTRDLKMYTISKDQSNSRPLRRLPTHILKTIGLETREVTDHMEATDGIDIYSEDHSEDCSSHFRNPRSNDYRSSYLYICSTNQSTVKSTTIQMNQETSIIQESSVHQDQARRNFKETQIQDCCILG